MTVPPRLGILPASNVAYRINELSVRGIAVAVVAATLVAACAESEPAASPPPAPAVRFSLAVVADPHVSRTGANEMALARAVDWINAEADARSIELVLVLGDIAWGDGMPLAKAQLDRLTPTYVPISGDNEVHLSAEEAYHTAFTPHYDRLAGTLDGWTRAPMPVTHPMTSGPAWLQNMAFDYRGLRFVGLDWAPRGVAGDIAGELGQLHDFDGGTWRFLESQLPSFEKAARKGVILFSHIPMHGGPFVEALIDRIETTLDPYYRQIYANLAGHMHLTYEVPVGQGLFDVYVTDPPWGEELSIRLVSVEGDGRSFTYEQAVVIVP